MPVKSIQRAGWFHALVVAELLVVALSISALVWVRHQTLEREATSLNALARMMALQADRTLRLGASVLRDTQDELQHGLIDPRSPQASQLLRSRVRSLQPYRALSVFDARGVRLATSRPVDTPLRADVAQTAFFRDATAPGAPPLHVSDAFVSPIDGQRTAVVASAWRNERGALKGVLVLSAPPEFLADGFELIRPGPEARLQLVRVEGGTSPVPEAMPDALVATAELTQTPMRWVLSLPKAVVLARWTDLAWLTAGIMAAMLAATTVLGMRLARAQVAQRAREQQEARARKLQALGQLASGVAHDFNNVLAAVVGFGEMARDAAAPGSRQAQQLDQVVEAGLRGRDQVARILAFSRGQVRHHVPFQPGPVVQEVLNHLEASRPASVQVQATLATPCLVEGDPTALYEAVMNLCTNALQAMHDMPPPAQGAHVLGVSVTRRHLTHELTLYDQQLPAGEHACISVTDTGQGMDAQVLARLFEPYFTTKGAGRQGGGTGLGLAVVHSVATDMGGAIDVRSTPGRGTRFDLYLPLCTRTEHPAPQPVSTEVPEGQGQCVLVVDDEPGLVTLCEDLLASLGYEPVGTSDPAQAWQAFQDDPQRFDLLLTDERMPGLSGTALAQAARGLRPDLPVVLLSGHVMANDALTQALVNRVLAKPVTRAELGRAVHAALSQARDGARRG